MTDGGAADNRGMVSLLYALLSALESRKSENLKLPDLHIVMAEASASNIDYEPSRGIGAKFGAAEKFASQLIEELFLRLENEYTKIDSKAKVDMHYLAMPAALRLRGGLGTHWMMPPEIKISNVFVADPEEASDYWIDRDDLESLIIRLHDKSGPVCEGEKYGDTKNIFELVLKDQHHQRWTHFLSCLSEGRGSRNQF